MEYRSQEREELKYTTHQTSHSNFMQVPHTQGPALCWNHHSTLLVAFKCLLHTIRTI